MLRAGVRLRRHEHDHCFSPASNRPLLSLLSCGWLTSFTLEKRVWTVSRRQNSAFFRHQTPRPARSGLAKGAADPAPEGVRERLRPLVAQEPRDLPHREVRLPYILMRQCAPQLIDEFGEVRPFQRQSPRERPRTDAQRLGHGLHVRPSVGQKAVDFIFDRGPQRGRRGGASLRCFLAIRTKRFQQVSVGGGERQVEHVVEEFESVDWSAKLNSAIVEPVEFLEVGAPRVRALHSARTELPAGGLAESLDDHRKLEFDVLPAAMARYAVIGHGESCSLLSSDDGRPHGVVDHLRIAGEKCESLANVPAGGNGVEEKADFSRIRLLREVKSERRVLRRFRGVFDELRLNSTPKSVAEGRRGCSRTTPPVAGAAPPRSDVFEERRARDVLRTR